MLRIVFIFLLLLGSVLLGVQLHQDPGYILIAVNHWTIETTLWIGLLSLLLLFIVLHLTLRSICKLNQTPAKIHQWNTRRLAQKAQAITHQGLIEYSEGYWQKAQNHLIQAIPNSETPLLNYLTAARAAQKMGDSQLRDHYLREAQNSMPEAKIAVELTQAQLQLANNQSEQALATLRHLHDLAPKHPYVLKLLMLLYQQVRDWSQLIALIPDLKKYQVMSAEELHDIQLNAYKQSMLDLAKQHNPDAVIAFFNHIPRALKGQVDLTTCYINFLLENHRDQLAEDLLQRTLKKEFNPQLIELYSQLPGNEQRFTFAESLLKKNALCAPLFLCLGRLAITQQLWGKAKHYLEYSIQLQATPQAYKDLGALHEQLEDPLAAKQYYKKGLETLINKH